MCKCDAIPSHTQPAHIKAALGNGRITVKWRNYTATISNEIRSIYHDDLHEHGWHKKDYECEHKKSPFVEHLSRKRTVWSGSRRATSARICWRKWRQNRCWRWLRRTAHSNSSRNFGVNVSGERWSVSGYYFYDSHSTRLARVSSSCSFAIRNGGLMLSDVLRIFT